MATQKRVRRRHVNKVNPPAYGIPAEIVVLGKSYKIKFVNEIRDDNNIKYSGETDLNDGIILIDRGTPDIMRRTFIHELVHIVFYKTNLNQQMICHEIEDIACDCIADLIEDHIVWSKARSVPLQKRGD